MPRCNICDCSNDPSVSVTEDCCGREVSWHDVYGFICDVCLFEINDAVSVFDEDELYEEDEENGEIMEGPTILGVGDMEGYKT